MVDPENRYSRFVRDQGVDIEQMLADQTFADLADVNLENAQDNDVLMFSNGVWGPGRLPEGREPVVMNDYYTKQEANALLENKALSSDIEQLNSEITWIKGNPNPSMSTIDDIVDNKISGLAEHEYVNLCMSFIEDMTGRIDELDSRPYLTENQVNTLITSKTDNLQDKIDAITLDSLDAAPLDHNHDDRYYKKDQTDSLLDSKANQNDLISAGNRITDLELKPEVTLDLLNGASKVHNHDDLYYRKTQSDLLLNAKADKSDLNSNTARINALESAPAVTLSSLNGVSQSTFNTKSTELQNSINAISLQSLGAAAVVHDHDDIYYRKAAIDSLLNAKAAASHNHDSSYYTKTQADTQLALKANQSDVNTINTTLSGLSASNYNYPLSEYGFHSISCPIGNSINFLGMIVGKLHLTRIYVPAGKAINSINFAVKTIGALPGAIPSGVALYSDSGVQLSSVTNTAFFTSTGWKTATLPSPIAAQATSKFYWVGIISGFLTLASLYSTADNPWNGPSTHRRNISVAGANALPTSFNPATYGSIEDVLPMIALG